MQYFVPGIHNRPTGGNIYNRRIIQFLQKQPGVQVEVIRGFPRESGSVLEKVKNPETSVEVIDSLLVWNQDVTPSLIEGSRNIRRVLMVHYLHLLDPEKAGSPRALREKNLLHAFDGFVATSVFGKTGLESAGIPGSRIGVIRPGLDSRFRPPVEFNGKDEIPHLLTVSNFEPGKGLVELLDILQRMADVSWTWHIVGGTALSREYLASFEERLGDSSILARTRIHGEVSDAQLLQLYNTSHVLVHPSSFETCGMVVMEAMSRGVPVVAYRVGGIPEIASGAARLVPQGNSDRFKEAIRDLIQNRNNRRRLAWKAREQSLRFHSWEKTGKQFLEFVSSL